LLATSLSSQASSQALPSQPALPSATFVSALSCEQQLATPVARVAEINFAPENPATATSWLGIACVQHVSGNTKAAIKINPNPADERDKIR
jgi:hypothetical protein